MARVTVEDCIEKVPNRFSLVLLAAHRARAVSAGAQIMVDRDNDKNPVVALREIADDVVDSEELREALTARRALEDAQGVFAALRGCGNVHFDGQARAAFGELCGEPDVHGLAPGFLLQDFLHGGLRERREMKLQAARHDRGQQ